MTIVKEIKYTGNNDEVIKELASQLNICVTDKMKSDNINFNQVVNYLNSDHSFIKKLLKGFRWSDKRPINSNRFRTIVDILKKFELDVSVKINENSYNALNEENKLREIASDSLSKNPGSQTLKAELLNLDQSVISRLTHNVHNERTLRIRMFPILKCISLQYTDISIVISTED